MNEIPKYVASRTLIQDDLTWSGSTLLPADDAIGAVCELRARDGKALQVMGSASLAAQLIEHDNWDRRPDLHLPAGRPLTRPGRIAA